MGWRVGSFKLRRRDFAGAKRRCAPDTVRCAMKALSAGMLLAKSGPSRHCSGKPWRWSRRRGPCFEPRLRCLQDHPAIVLHAGIFRGPACCRPQSMRSDMTPNQSGDRPEHYRFHNGSKAVLPFAMDNMKIAWRACAILWICTGWMRSC